MQSGSYCLTGADDGKAVVVVILDSAQARGVALSTMNPVCALALENSLLDSAMSSFLTDCYVIMTGNSIDRSQQQQSLHSRHLRSISG